MRNEHNYMADVDYGWSAEADDDTPYDHTALYQNPGQTNAAIATVANCTTVYFGARGKPSKR
ncbi:hypothetical protein [Terriglobus albidus]|uniref:hypothetical protein n=1 Tax=Terriglobus albidus TaxID=1592106 RepID=UPI0021DFB115|nr:hypothetical protein [Terriglobus albidus]